jgi:APA family basic amino acid/polyamine antiporter
MEAKSDNPNLKASTSNLARVLALRHFVAIGINMCIGGSIFFIGADAYRLVGSWSVVVAVVVGLFSLLMGLIFAEVSSRFDGTGGPYIYGLVAFGPFVGSELAWMMWCTRVLAQASLTNAVLTSIAYFFGGDMSPVTRLISICILNLSIMVIHLCGIEQGARTILGFSVAKMLPLAFVLVAGMVRGHIGPVSLASAPKSNLLGETALLLLFSFSGYEVIAVTAGEARNPRRDAPLATVITVGVMVSVWICLQLVLIRTVPNLATETRPVVAAAASLAGPFIAMLINVGAIVSALGTCVGTLLSASRSLYALGADRLAPAWFGTVNKRTGVPSRAIILSTISVLGLSVSGSFVFLAAAAAVPRLLVFFAVSAALLRLRANEGRIGLQRPRFRLCGGRLLSISAMTGCALVLVGLSRAQLGFGIGGVMLGAGLYVFGRFNNGWVSYQGPGG